MLRTSLRHLRTSAVTLMLIGLGVSGIAQTFVAIGTSSAANANTSYPSPFGDYYENSRAQYLYRAAELTAAGVPANAIISAIRWNVTAVGTSGVHDNYTLKVGPIASATNQLNTGTTFLTSPTTRFGPANITPSSGGNVFTFNTPFTWNGTDNLLIEICHANAGADGSTDSENGQVSWQTGLAYRASMTTTADNNGTLCTVTTSRGTQTTRPWLTVGYCTSAAPTVSISALSSTCAGSTLELTGNVTGTASQYEWTGPNSFTSAVQNPSVGSITTAGSGTYTFRARNGAAGCWSTTATQSVTVNPTPPTVSVTTNSGSTCNGTTPSGNVLVASACAAWTQPTRTSTFPGSNYNNDNTSMTTMATVNLPALPSGSVVTAARLKLTDVQAYARTCLGSNNDSRLSEIRIGLSGIYSLGSTQISSSAAAGTIATHTITLTLTTPQAAAFAAGGSLNLQALETTDQSCFIETQDSRIGGATVELDYTLPTTFRWYNASTGGSVVSTSPGMNPVTGLGANNVSNSVPATHTFHAICESSAGCGTRVPATFTVHPLPTMNCPANSSVCISAAAFSLSGASPTPGTYSGPGVSAGTFNPATAGLGVKTITFTHTNGNGCTNTCTFTITVNALPVMTCPANSTACIDDAPIALTASPAPGTFTGVGVSGGMFNPATAGLGTHTITYSHTNANTCTNSCTFTITVHPLPTVVSNTGGGTVCITDPLPNVSFTFSGTPPYQFEISGPSSIIETAWATNTYTINGAAAGTYNVAQLSDAHGCSAVTLGSFVTVTVVPQPDAGIDAMLTTTSTSLPTNMLILLGPNAQVGGSWSGPSSVVGNAYDPLTMAPGVYTYTRNANSPCTGSDQATVTVTEVPITALTLDLTMPFFGNLPVWELREVGTNSVAASGGGDLVFFEGVHPQPIGLPPGKFYLSFPNGADPATDYVLRTPGNPGSRLIENRAANPANHQVAECAASPAILSSNGAVQIPISNNRLIFTSCDKYWWRTGEFLVANEDPDVAADWVVGGTNAVQDPSTGYDFWFYDPDGGYSFIRQRRHNNHDGFGNVGSTRTCHMQINNWSAASHIPQNMELNVRVRAVVNGNPKNWGPACRFTRNEALANCPPTKLLDIPGEQYFSCNVNRNFSNTTANRLYAKAVSEATKYKFTFTNSEATITREVTTYYLNLGWSAAVAPRLQAGATYAVTVQAFKNGAYCTAGEICSVTINAAVSGGQQNSPLEVLESSAALNLWPNPNHGDELFVSLSELPEGASAASLDLYDLSGKRMITRTIPLRSSTINTVVDLNSEIAAGIYLAKLTVGQEVFTQRLVVQK